MNKGDKEIRKLLEQGCLIFVKNGIMKVIKPLEFGEITLHYQNGQIDRTTTKTSKKI